LVIAYGFMDSHKDMIVNKFRMPTTKHFFQRGKYETLEGGNFVVYWWWMQKNGVRNERSGAKVKKCMPTCYRLTFMCCQPCLFNIQCF